MKTPQKTKKICIFLSLILFINIFMPETCSAGSVPKPDAAVTESNVMSVIKSCDAEGAYILKLSAEKGRNILSWWYSGNSITSAMDVAVHEECHRYIHYGKTSLWNAKILHIYVGKKKEVKVSCSKVFYTTKMKNSIPKRFRTSRYDTYVANKENVSNLSSDVDGVYGLLNEFTAYCWGMNTAVSLYNYYSNLDNTPDTWMEYLYVAGGNKILSYVELKYFILHYILYAKKYHPKVYRGIIKNKKFAKAYIKIDKIFAKIKKRHTKNFKNIVKKLKNAGYESEYKDGDFWIGNQGVGMYDAEYSMFEKELKKTKYRKIQKKLKKKAK